MNNELLQRFVESRSEEAFAEVVRQHLDLVYSAALRQVNGDCATAQDIAQAVFSDLARKAPGLTLHTSLTGWLYTSTRFLAAKARREDQRRRAREQQAYAMNQILNSTEPDPCWQELRPALDDAMHELNAPDRDAILLRFFENRPLAEVGSRLGLSENAARMRVERALAKLRDALIRRGVSSTVAALAILIGERAVNAAPAGLGSQVSQLALGAAVSAGSVWSWLAAAKVKWALFTAGVAIVATWLVWSNHANTRSLVTDAQASLPAKVETAQVNSAASEPGTTENSQSVAAVLPSTNQMILQIVAADDEKPVPNVNLDYWLWLGSESKHRKPLQSSPLGRCEVPVPRDRVTRLILVSQVEGFADTRLEWNVDRGATIPEQYTLRLRRATPIGGLVVDPDGRPVPDAQVGFNNESDPRAETYPECRNFGWPFWITATTDAEGRWKIDRLAREMLASIYGSASHSNYTGSEMIYPSRNAEAGRQLLQQAFVFRLGHAVSVAGVVVDANNQPLSGARILVGRRGDSRARETTTHSDGTFQVAGCQPGKSTITAEADGYAPATLPVSLEENSAPLRIVLQPGRMLSLRVVDQQGAPIKKAHVWLDTVNDRSNDETAPLLQAAFNPDTDADGRVVWENAPDRELSFDIGASGFMNAEAVRIRPDGLEHLVTLPPGLTISGAVRDAETGQPIPKFRIVTGWQDVNPISGATNQHWSTIDRFWLTFEGGKFQHVYEEPVLGASPNPGFIFKILADGYAPAVTRHLAIDEREARFEIALQRAQSLSVTVLLPDGRPAAEAEIGLVFPGAGLRLVPGGFGRIGSHSASGLLSADESGRFTLAPDASVVRIIAAHPEGYSEATVADVSKQPTLVLQPWGRLEGTFLSAGAAASGRALLFQYGNGDRQTVSAEFARYQVKTDAAGHFAFPQVPPGKHKLVELIEEHGQPGTAGIVWSHHPLRDVEIRPGETSTITIERDNPLLQSAQ